jgi:YD repeat-containing protein
MNMLRYMSKCAVVLSCVLAVFGARAGTAPDPANPTIPSFYAEAGLTSGHAHLSTHGDEHIDTFTGKLQWHNVDLVVPGNGGLDLVVKRSYASPGIEYPEASPLGYGWTMHYGRVTRNAIVDICSTDATTYKPTANPVLELPDGGRQILYVALDGVSFITTNFWRAVCSQSGAGGLIVYSPDGTRYDMTTPGAQIGDPTHVVNTWYTTQITDRNGNTMSFTYQFVGASFGVSAISAGDGRQVTFNYSGSGLSSVTDGSRTWNYTNSGGFLTKVTRPDGNSWSYSYNPIAAGNIGNADMTQVTYPTGGTISYTYNGVYFNASLPQSSVVATKKTSDGGSWSYTYQPATQTLPNDTNVWINPPDSGLDITTVTGPDGTRVYKHVGYTSAPSGFVFQIGQLVSDNIGGVQADGYSSGLQLISMQPNQRPGDNLTYDLNTYAPIPFGHGINRYGQTYSTKDTSVDQFGNPTGIVETGTDQLTRSVTYNIDTSKWILHLKKDESVAYNGPATNPNLNTTVSTVTRSFDGNGNLLSENDNGVATTYTYYATGDLKTHTDARNYTTTYSDYYRGIPRTESQPENVTVKRTVSDAGDIMSVTDGELATTSYQYDGLDRLTQIQHPLGNPINVTWTANKRSVVRGNFKEDRTYEGFGRESDLLYTDTTSGETIHTSNQYDAAGRRIFSTYPNASVGSYFWYDTLGTTLQVAHAYDMSTGYAASWRTYVPANNTVQLTNERSLVYTYTYRGFGDPSGLALMQVDAPESSASVVIARDGANQMTGVTQGGKTRNYVYDSRHFLTSKSEPEVGTTSYGRDAVGNMTSTQVGASGTTQYIYDGRNRLTSVSYPDGGSIARTYYKDDKLQTLANGVAFHTYHYDTNKNLQEDDLTLGAQAFAVMYGYDGNDALASVKYGSGKTVTYSPNAFGRATQAAPYVTSVSYHPTGEVKSMTYANGVQTTTTLNARLWPEKLKIGNGSLMFDKSYYYDQTGNVLEIDDAALATQRQMVYDNIDRLKSVTGIPSGPYSATYDGRGNLLSQTWGGTTPVRALSYAYDPASDLLTTLTDTKGGTASNFAYGYDTYGNVTAKGGTNFTYSDALTMKCSNCGKSNEVDYDYDGAALRVRMQKAGVSTYFVYGLGGKLLWEQIPGGALTEYVYLAGKQVATRQQLPVSP